MLMAASEAIANCVSNDQLNDFFIIPSVFDEKVVKEVAAAITKFHQL
jgi:malate dehydrogenase (oxaloacetate-decarboxylating)